MSDWKGKPKWNGKEVFINLEGAMLAIHDTFGPVLTLIDNCDDYFLSIFTEVEDLHKHMKYLQQRGLGNFEYSVKKIDDPSEFLDSLREAGVRIMLNPEVINENHTKWKEVIRNGEQWKYVDAELN